MVIINIWTQKINEIDLMQCGNPSLLIAGYTQGGDKLFDKQIKHVLKLNKT